MPELPEITVIAEQMDKELRGKKVANVDITQPRILNVDASEFARTIANKTIIRVSGVGKWLFIQLDPHYYLLINLGMGADLTFVGRKNQRLGKFQFRLVFDDGTGFMARFWWFGYVHLVHSEKLADHKMTAALGESPIDKTFTLAYFKKLMAGRKGAVKSFLLNQKNVAGIGNVYIQDILFRAKLHPKRDLSNLTEKEIKTLHDSIRKVLNSSINLGGLAYEKDFYGKRGKYSTEKFLVGYRQGKPCPMCGYRIEKIKTGSTSSYICPKCQKLN